METKQKSKRKRMLVVDEDNIDKMIKMNLDTE